MTAATVTFTPKIMTVFVEHERLMNETISAASGLSTTDYCILRALYLEGGEVSGIEFASFLLLKHNSISAALLRLRNRGFVDRFPSDVDARVTVTRITDEGVSAAREATARTYEALKETFWRDFTDDEIVRAVSVSRDVMGAFGAVMDDIPKDRSQGHTPLLPEFILGVKRIIQRWTATLSAQYGLSLSEYRLLAVLAASPEPVIGSEVARSLFLPPSVVSVLKSGLMDRGLVASSGPRGRGSLLTCTPQGMGLAANATQSLATVTAETYAGLDDQTVLYLDEWHTRMYRILMTSARLLR